MSLKSVVGLRVTARVGLGRAESGLRQGSPKWDPSETNISCHGL